MLARNSARQRDERGSGLISSLFGAVAFLGFLLLASNVLIGLYATSVTTTVAWDAARTVASANGDPNAVAAAQSRASEKLHGLDNVQFHWWTENDQIALQVTASRPSLMPPSLFPGSRLTTIDRTVWVRMEDTR